MARRSGDCAKKIPHYRRLNSSQELLFDVDEALHAAASIGDDRIQRMSGRQISPESFTHGSSAQRVHWFQQGMNTGSVESCNTFTQ